CGHLLSQYLEKARPKHQEVAVDGLPAGWRMVWLEEQSLSEDQLCLPREARRSRICRLEGGTSISIDGARQYLHYDLPRVIVAAPAGATATCNGSRLQQLSRPTQDLVVPGVPMAEAETSFELPESVERGGIFSIEVVGRDGKRLKGGLTIRVKDPEAFPINAGSTGCGIDRFGRTLPASDAGAGN